MLVSVFAAFRDMFSMKSVDIFDILGKTLFFTVLAYVLAFSMAYFVLLQVNLLSVMWLDRLLDVAGLLATFVLGLFLFPSVLSVFAEFFAEDAIDNTERHLFAELPKKNEISFFDYLFVSCNIGIKSLFCTLILGVLYILFMPAMALTLSPIGMLILYPLVFWIANGSVLAHGYYTTISMRYLNHVDSAELWDKGKAGFILIGVLCCFMYTIPVLNIFVPIYSYSLATRYFWRIYNDTFGKVKSET